MKKTLFFVLALVAAMLAGCQETNDPIPTQSESITYEGNGPWVIHTLYDTDDVVVADIIVDPAHYDVDPTGKEDSSIGIQRALNDARKMDGGTVWLPAGQYRITRALNVPAFVTLRGDWQDPDVGTEYGTVLLMDIPAVDENYKSGSINISGSAGVMGLTVYYPNQSLENVQPYPFTFYVNGLGDGYMLQSIVNCTLLNSYKGIGACVQEGTPHEMMTVENVKGTVLCLGAEVYNQADVGTWKDVAFTPDYWADAPEAFAPPKRSELAAYTRENATGLKLGDLEWTQFAHIRLSDFKTGIHIVTGKRIQFAGSIYDAHVTNCGTALLADNMDDRWGTVIARSVLSGDQSLINNTGGQFRLAGVTLEGSFSGDILIDDTDPDEFAPVPHRAPEKPNPLLTVAVLEEGGKTDVSQALQEALDSMAESGGIVYVPAGLYRLDAPVTVPAGVELRGASSVAQREQSMNSDGTLFLVCPTTYSNAVDAALSKALVTLDGDNAGIRGVRFLYPDNITAAATGGSIQCSAYTVRGKGAGVYAINVAITGGYYGIDFKTCDRHIIKRFVGSCVNNAMYVGGRDGLVEGCLQNGNTFCRMGVSQQYVTSVPEAQVFELVFDPILRQTSVFIRVQKGAQGQTVFNSFAYGVKTFLSSGGDVTVFNVGADNVGSGSPMLELWDGSAHVTNMMRYNGVSYTCNGARLVLHNRLTIAQKEETQSVTQ
ncbi:MAG: hypothetical protein E7436_02430 [Ruminococcaceae bacterium]|nr:hypothetical protein [Oscillospiraceae bacterium]